MRGSCLTVFIRVALINDSYKLHKILPTKVDPLVSLMKVEKVPDSTYEVGCRPNEIDDDFMIDGRWIGKTSQRSKGSHRITC